MSQNSLRVPLRGSGRVLLPGSRLIGSVAPDEVIEVTIVLRRKRPIPTEVVRDAGGRRQFLTKAEVQQDFGVGADDLAKVTAFAEQFGLGLRATERDPAAFFLSGLASAMQNAFGTVLKHYRSPQGRYRGRYGSLSIPRELHEVITAVFGLDNRPVATAHFQVGPVGGAAMLAFTPVQIAEMYNFPAGLTGAGQAIGIIELGGGFRPAELAQYFGAIGVAPPPTVTEATYPNSGSNAPGTNALDPASSDIEVMLDIQVIGSIVPGAQIFVYFAPDSSDQSFRGAMAAAVHDPNVHLDVISVSWGGAEVSGDGGLQAIVTEAFQDEFGTLLAAAQQMGTTVCVASGDFGSAAFPLNDPKNPWDGHAHTGYPASDPLALGCGGTVLTVMGGQITNEQVWLQGPNSGSGGGVSRYFALPAYQNAAGVPPAVNPAGGVMRGVPDVAGNAARETGYKILCDGKWFPDPANPNTSGIGGTSAVAPLWAALIAMINQERVNLGKTRLGSINGDLYQIPAGSNAFRDIRLGTNGDYQAGNGWDACTGLGSPNGQVLLQILSALP